MISKKKDLHHVAKMKISSNSVILIVVSETGKGCGSSDHPLRGNYQQQSTAVQQSFCEPR